jgi:hypothetical protein
MRKEKGMTGSALFDHDSWEGEYEQLADVREELVVDEKLCERTFCSKHEAFMAGLVLGQPTAEES